MKYYDAIVERDREANLKLLASRLKRAEEIVFRGRYFMFTEPFNLGSRKKCAEAVIERGGIFMDKKRPSKDLHYLVLGEKEGHWMDGDLVGKISHGLELIKQGFPISIITETSFTNALETNQDTHGKKGFIVTNTLGRVPREIHYKKPIGEPTGSICNDIQIGYLIDYISSAKEWANITVKLPFKLNTITTNQANILAKDLRLIRRDPFLFITENPECVITPLSMEE